MAGSPPGPVGVEELGVVADILICSYSSKSSDWDLEREGGASLSRLKARFDDAQSEIGIRTRSLGEFESKAGRRELVTKSPRARISSRAEFS
jgi:hypothetical protein